MSSVVSGGSVGGGGAGRVGVASGARSAVTEVVGCALALQAVRENVISSKSSFAERFI